MVGLVLLPWGLLCADHCGRCSQSFPFLFSPTSFPRVSCLPETLHMIPSAHLTSCLLFGLRSGALKTSVFQLRSGKDQASLWSILGGQDSLSHVGLGVHVSMSKPFSR